MLLLKYEFRFWNNLPVFFLLQNMELTDFLHVADVTCNVYMYFTGMLFYCIDLYARKHGDYWWSRPWYIIPTGTHYIKWKYILELVLLLNVFVWVLNTCIEACSVKHFFYLFFTWYKYILYSGKRYYVPVYFLNSAMSNKLLSE